SRASLLNSFDFTASCRPLRCMMFLNCECPAIVSVPGSSYCGLAMMSRDVRPRSRSPQSFKASGAQQTSMVGTNPATTMRIGRRYRLQGHRFQTFGGRRWGPPDVEVGPPDP